MPLRTPDESSLAPPVLLTAWAGVGVLLFLIACVTGIVMRLQFDASTPNESLWLWQEQPHQTLLRGVHYWAAHLGVIAAIFDLIGRFLAGRHRPPFAMPWILSVALLLLIAAAALTGELLMGDARAISRAGWMQARLGLDLDYATALTIHTIVLPLLIAGVLGLRAKTTSPTPSTHSESDS